MRAWPVAAVALLLVGWAAPGADAFALLKTGDRTWEAHRSPRWNATTEPLAGGGPPGLGGGLEFSVDRRFCTDLEPAMVDGSGCRAILGAVLEAFGAWEAANPRLLFRDVSDDLPAARDGSEVDAVSSGAEFDLMVESGAHDTTGQGTGAFANTLSRKGPVRSTNGATAQGEFIASVDIVLYARTGCTDATVAGCYTLAELRTILEHEIGHGLGLDHPFEYDAGLALSQPVDCVRPKAYLTPFERPSVMNYERVGKHAPGVAQDDREAITLLYPPCTLLQVDGDVVHFVRHGMRDGAGDDDPLWTAAYAVQDGRLSGWGWLGLALAALAVLAAAAWLLWRRWQARRQAPPAPLPAAAPAFPPSLPQAAPLPPMRPIPPRPSPALYTRPSAPARPPLRR